MLIFLFVIPISLALFAVTLDRIEAVAAAQDGRERRAQARLLAESALERLRAEGGSDKIAGEIQGIGPYRARLERRPGGDSEAEAEGIVERAAASRGARRTVCHIRARLGARETGAAAPTLEIISMEFRVER